MNTQNNARPQSKRKLGSNPIALLCSTALSLSAAQAFAVGAASDVLPVNHLGRLNQDIAVPNYLLALKDKRQYAPLALDGDTLPVIDMLVFYQPTYAALYGEDVMHQRIIASINVFNEAMLTHGYSDYRIEIKDIVPTQSIPDDLPFFSVVDEKGDEIQRGAASLFSGKVFNEVYVTLNNDGSIASRIPNPEYALYQKHWKADMVLYVREGRADEIGGSSGAYGSAALNGEYANAMDIGAEIGVHTVVAHEIGHNFGMDHQEGSGTPVNIADYARAWECGNQGTIMYAGREIVNSRRHFSDPNITYNNQACGDAETAYNAKVIDDNYLAITQRREGVTPTSTVSFSRKDYTGNESDGVVIGLTRRGELDAASVKVFAQSDSAVFGEDYVKLFVVAEFAEGQEQVDVVFPMVNDGDSEGQEHFTVALQYPYKMTLGEQASADITLLDGDIRGEGGMLAVSAPAELVEGQEGEVRITRNGGVGEIVVKVKGVSQSDTWPYETEMGKDFVLSEYQLVFAQGETEKVVTLKASDNHESEITKTFDVVIESPNNGVTYSPQKASVTLIDDDFAGGVYAISSPIEGQSISEGIGKLDVVVGRRQGYEQSTVTITLDVKGTQSTVDVDFAKDEWEKTVQVDIPDNTVEEANYEITLSLSTSDPTASVETREGYVPSRITLTVIDNDKAPAPKPTANSDNASSGGGSMGWWLLGLIPLVLGRWFERVIVGDSRS